MIQNKVAQLIIDAHIRTLIYTENERQSKSGIDCFKFLQTDLYLLSVSKSVSVVYHFHGLNLCFMATSPVSVWYRDEDIFQNITNPPKWDAYTYKERPNSAIQLLIDFYSQK